MKVGKVGTWFISKLNLNKYLMSHNAMSISNHKAAAYSSFSTLRSKNW